MRKILVLSLCFLLFGKISQAAYPPTQIYEDGNREGVFFNIDVLTGLNVEVTGITAYISATLISGGTLISANHCRYDGTGIDCDRPEDASGACATNSVCMGGHNHDVAGLSWDNDWMVAYSNGSGLVELPLNDGSGSFLKSNGEAAPTWSKTAVGITSQTTFDVQSTGTQPFLNVQSTGVTAFVDLIGSKIQGTGLIATTNMQTPIIHNGADTVTVGMGAGSSLTFDGDSGTDGVLRWVPSTDVLQLENGGKLQVNSAGDDKNIQMYHNDTYGYISTSSGSLYLTPNQNTFVSGSAAGYSLTADGYSAGGANNSIGLYGRGYGYRTGATMTSLVKGGEFEAIVIADNTQNWTNAIGLQGVESNISVTTGASGTITGAANFYALSNIDAATVTNLYGVYIATPTGAGTISNKYAFVSEPNAGNVGIGTITPAAALDVLNKFEVASTGITSYVNINSTGLTATTSVATPVLHNGADAITIGMGVGANLNLDTSTGKGVGLSPSASGVLTIGGRGNTNNENLTFDFETTANAVRWGTSSGAGALYFVSVTPTISDWYGLNFGDNQDSSFEWVPSVASKHYLGLGLKLSGTEANDSGYFQIMERADLENANRDPGGVSANPVLRVYSADAAVATDYIELYHDQTVGTIKSGEGLTVTLPATGLTASVGFNPNKNGNAVCWNGNRLGYCSSQPDANGQCTCN